jgi:hypothetical protein
LQIALWVANLILLSYGGYKFLNKPHSDLEDRVDALEDKSKELELKIKEHEESLRVGNDRFRKQKRSNAAFKNIMLSFIDFEIAFCQETKYANIKDLELAKAKLQKYLTEDDEDD